MGPKAIFGPRVGLSDLLQTPRPAGGFGLIEADPPWPYEGWGGADLGVFNPRKNPLTRLRPIYPTMSMEDLKRLPVRMLAARDCVLHMWVVDANLEQALELGRAWGFAYKSRGLTWDKGRMTGGWWFRKEAEIALLFTRGSPKRLSRGVPDMIREKPREHSRKPDCRYDRLEALAKGPYLELFARTQRPGWASWGNETDKFSADPDAASQPETERLAGAQTPAPRRRAPRGG